MKRSLNFLIFSLFNLLAFSAQARWYWPFGHDEDSTNAPPRLHRLLEKANDYIELAEDEALNGNADKAIDNYKLALDELDRVEAENPDRAETPEFAPLRNRRAVCSAAMDAIRFAQVNENERSVAVSDTTELQKRWNKKHGIKSETASSAPEAPKKPVAEAKPAERERPQAAEAGSSAPVVVGAMPVSGAQSAPAPKKWMERFRQAKELVRARDYAAADILLEGLCKERPNDLNAILLRAAAQSGQGSNHAAWRTLEKAMRTHPRSFLPYYNLAQLALAMNEGVDVAREYYEMGRFVGGPVNAALESRLKETK